MAGLGHRSDATEGPLISVLQSSTREGPLRIVEPPSSVGDNSAVPDPEPTFGIRKADVRLPAFAPDD